MVLLQFNYTKVGWLFIYFFSDKVVFYALQIRLFSAFAVFCSGLFLKISEVNKMSDFNNVLLDKSLKLLKVESMTQRKLQ